MKLTFDGSIQITGGVVSFVFKTEEAVWWEPGQFMFYKLPHADMDDRGDERWFTISSAPSEGRIVISTRIDNERVSSFKRALLAMSPGDQIEAEGPEGDFVVLNESRNYVFVAGGIGITPFRSILTEAHALGRQLHVTLLYANRDQEIPFADELEALKADNPNLTVAYVIQPDVIDAAMIKQHVDGLDNPLVYLSGPEPMVKGMAAELETIGLVKDSIKIDEFPGYLGF